MSSASGNPRDAARAAALGSNDAPTAIDLRPSAEGATGREATRLLPLLVLGIVVVSWGAGPPTTKLITAPPLVATTMRFAITVPFLLLIVRLAGLRLTRRVLWATALPGSCFGINLVFVFAALQEASVSVLSVITAMQPALLLLLAGPLFGERPSVAHVTYTLVGIGGAAGVILGAGDEVRTTALGVALGLVSMLTFTVYFVLTRMARTGTDVNPLVWMAGINLWALVAVVVPAAVWVDGDDISRFGGADWVYLLIVAYVTGVLGHVLMSWVHGHIEAARSSLYILAMHLVAVGLAWPIHDEPITLTQAAAGVVVLGSVAAVIRIPARPAAGT